MLREILARFGIRVNTAPLKAANAQVSGFTRNLGIMGGLLAGGLIVRGLQNFVRGQIILGDQTAKTARQLGISARELSAWSFAADRSGVAQTQLTNGFRRLQRNIVDANEGLSTAVRAFTSLGVATEDATGAPRELLDIMPDLADAFVNLSTDTERSARAQQIFGRSGANLLPFFEEGAEGIDELLKRFEELGVGLDEEFFAGAEAAQDALADFDLAMTGLKATIAPEILPAVSRLAGKPADLIAQFTEATQGTGLWEAALISLGAIAASVAIAMFIAFIKPILIILLIAAAIFVVVLAIDDLLTFMQGGDSVIGKFFDSLGLDTERLRNDLNAFVDDQVTFWTETFPGFLSDMGDNFSRFADDQAEFWGRIGRQASEFGSDFIQLWGTDIPEAFGRGVDRVAAFIAKLVAGITSAINTVQQGIGSLAGFFGIGVAGGGPRPSSGVRGGAGGTTANIAQDVSVNIDNRGGGDTRGITRAVREAMERANTLVVRNAQRALTQVVD